MPAQANVSLGREVEFWNRVNDSDPTNAVLKALVLASPAEALSVLKTYDTVATLLAANPEVTNTNYARIELDDADLSPYTVDDTNHTIPLTLPLLTWDAGGGPDAGDAWDYLVLAYDPDSTGGTDTTVIPISFHELRRDGAAIVPNGSPIVVDLTDAWITARQYP